MTNKFSSVSIFVLASFLASGAIAADINGSLKDGPSVFGEERSSSTWNGWYVTGALGVAQQDYDADRQITREYGNYNYDKNGVDRNPGDGDAILNSGATDPKNPIFKADNTPQPLRYYNDPRFSHRTLESFSFDSGNGLEGGAELSYKMQRGRFIIEPFVSGNLSSADESGVSYEHSHKWIRNETGNEVSIDQDGSGHVSVSKNFDANAGLKLGYLVTPNVNLYIGGGLTYGDFDIKGGDVFKNGQVLSGRKYPYSIDESDNSFGYVLLSGVQVKQGRFVFGVQGEYRDYGSIDAGASSLVTSGTATSESGNYSRMTGSDSIDTTEWAVKGTLSIQLSD
jgi:hypothetical protein